LRLSSDVLLELNSSCRLLPDIIPISVRCANKLDMGRSRFFNSVSVFGILLGIFSKSVRFSVSVFF
jgi:hypothetical protein